MIIPMLALGNRAHEVFNEIVALRHGIEVRFLTMGQLLIEVHDDRLYEVYGCESFEDFCGIPEISLSRRHAYRLIDIATTFGLVVPPVAQEEWFGQLARVGVKKLAAIAPLVRAEPESAAEWLGKAEALSSSALDEEIRADRHGAVVLPDDWTVRRLRDIRAVAQEAIDGRLAVADAADRICAEAMRIRERCGGPIQPD